MWYWIFREISFIILRLFFSFKIEGLENVPQKTNFIVVANHASFLDPFVVSAAIPKKIYWIAWRGFLNKFTTKWFMHRTDVLAVGSSSDKALYLLTENKNIGLFPEGTRSYDGSLGEFRRGAALLALKSGRPVVPCAISGTYEALPRKAKFPKFRPIKIKIGKPKYLFKEFEDVIDEIYLNNGVFKIRNAIKEMLYAG